jgi:hypothetical protein
MKRRAFITLLTGSAVWPFAAKAEQPKRRIGALILQSENNDRGSVVRNSGR